MTTPPTAMPNPFGLPAGTVRGLLSILICSFVWVVLLLPETYQVKVVLAHFFLLGLVLMAFASSPSLSQSDASPFLPWLFRLIFVGGSVLSLVIAWTKGSELVQFRLTPDIDEVKQWWIPFLACLGGGFGFGVFLRFILGRTNHVFQSLRAWFSVVGMIMLVLEMGVFFALLGEGRVIDFLHYWQCVTLVVVAAYFGTRA
jgi:hypothetical protein